MTNKIFKSTFAVALIVLTASVLIIVSVLYAYFGAMQQAQLREELELAASAVQEIGQSYLEGGGTDHFRMTWVDGDGTVLFDSFAEADTLENHSDREEIREALADGYGSSVRNSATLTEQTVYEALRLEDGSVLRMSVSRATGLVLVIGMLRPICVVLLVALGASAWLAYRMARRVVEPLNALNLEEPLENDVYEELSPLLRRIHAQHQEIREQMQTLRHKQDELDQITGNMREAMVLLDNEDKILNINPAAKVLFDVGDACMGKDILSIQRRQDMRAALEEAKERGYASFRAPNGGRVYQFDLSRIDSAGGVCGLVLLAFDVTEQVNAERNRQEFTANVSHELKTPLQSIIGSAELLENGIVKQEDVPRFVGRIRKEAARLVTLVDDVIRLAQLDEGRELPRESVSLRTLAEEACETLADAAERKQVTLEVTGGSGVIDGVRGTLYEVIYNLCDNGIKYNRPGGSVSVEIEETLETVTARVRDTGIGVVPEEQEKIFERFYRVDKSHSKQSGGTGLGLSIVKHAVQYHHGRIQIDSRLGEGTTISVTFPRRSDCAGS